MKIKHFFLMLVMALTVSFPAYALDLHSARSAGIVGEKADGYVAVIQDSSEAKALVAEVNSKRQAEYARIAAQNGQTVDVVAKLAAVQIIGKLNKGEYYQDPSGAWVRR